jgi:PAS domain S-box-containing protein
MERQNIIVIEVSAGGISALKQLFAAMSADSGKAFVVVSCPSQEHEESLAPVLQAGAKIPVREVTETVAVEPDNIYVVPPGKSFELTDDVIELDESGQAPDNRISSVDLSCVDSVELLRAEAVLRESEEEYRTLFNSMDEGYCVIEMIFDEQGEPNDWRFLKVNPAFEKNNGLTDAAGKTILELTPDIEPKWFAHYGKVALTGEPSRFVEHSVALGRWFDLYAFRIGAPELRQVAVLFNDITTRRLAEGQLQESDERLRLIMNSAKDYAIISSDVDGCINDWNSGAEKVFGYTKEEILGQHSAILFTPEDRLKGAHLQEMQTALEKGKAEDERWHLHKDGTRFYVSGIMHPLRGGKVEGFVKIARDMTDRIRAEQIARDREMLQKLVGAQEDERKRIARDLHDELGQKLTGLRLVLETIKKTSRLDDEVVANINEAQTLAKQIDDGVDFLAWELRPAALDDLGLAAALQKYISEWSNFSGILTELRVSGLKKKRLPPEIETNLYRITQEALNNTHKHAGAARAEISFEKRNNSVILIIEDDGKGFNINSVKNRTKGIGLIGMQERAALIGGTLEIESGRGKGTRVYVRIPAVFNREE